MNDTKRITVTEHDSKLIQWLVEFYKKRMTGERFPAYQNVDELAEKFKVTNKVEGE